MWGLTVSPETGWAEESSGDDVKIQVNSLASVSSAGLLMEAWFPFLSRSRGPEAATISCAVTITSVHKTFLDF